jgi:hypothetical protein
MASEVVRRPSARENRVIGTSLLDAMDLRAARTGCCPKPLTGFGIML